MEKIYKEYLLSAQGALLGKVKPNLRAVAIGWESYNSIKLKFILDTNPTEVDRDLLSEACGEIIADFPNIQLEEYCEFSLDQPKKILEKGRYKQLIYLRYEDFSILPECS